MAEKPPFFRAIKSANVRVEPIDVVWKKVGPNLNKKYASFMFVLPAAKEVSILVRANPESKTVYKTDFRYFDQYTGREIAGAYVWGRYKDATVASDYLKRMNYDIHTEAILGLPGRIVLFFVALIVTSLPVTGFIFWRGRKHGKRLKQKSIH